MLKGEANDQMMKHGAEYHNENTRRVQSIPNVLTEQAVHKFAGTMLKSCNVMNVADAGQQFTFFIRKLALDDLKALNELCTFIMKPTRLHNARNELDISSLIQKSPPRVSEIQQKRLKTGSQSNLEANHGCS